MEADVGVAHTLNPKSAPSNNRSTHRLANSSERAVDCSRHRQTDNPTDRQTAYKLPPPVPLPPPAAIWRNKPRQEFHLLPLHCLAACFAECCCNSHVGLCFRGLGYLVLIRVRPSLRRIAVWFECIAHSIPFRGDGNSMKQPPRPWLAGLKKTVSLTAVVRRVRHAVARMTTHQRHTLFKVLNQEFWVDNKFRITKELGQGAYGIVWCVPNPLL